MGGGAGCCTAVSECTRCCFPWGAVFGQAGSPARSGGGRTAESLLCKPLHASSLPWGHGGVRGWGRPRFARCTGFLPQRTASGSVSGEDEYLGLGTVRAGLLLVLLYQTHVNVLLGCRALGQGSRPRCWPCCRMLPPEAWYRARDVPVPCCLCYSLPFAAALGQHWYCCALAPELEAHRRSCFASKAIWDVPLE